MSWLRLDDKFARHRKVAPLSDFAFRLHVTSMGHAAEFETDGAVTRQDLSVMPSLPRGRKLESAIAELEAGGLWERQGEAWTIHDFTDWNPTASDLKTKREAAKERMRCARELRANRTRTSDELLANAQRSSRGVRSTPARPGPSYREEDPSLVGQTPSGVAPEFSSARRSDASFGTGAVAPGARDDVRQLHEVWRTAVGLPQHTLRGAFSLDASTLAGCIDGHGLEDCLLVAKHCASDGMVTGKLDDKGRDHRTIKYIFDNLDTFTRILKRAHEAEGRDGKRRSATDLVREAQRL